MINIAVCDDNPIFLEETKSLVEKVFFDEHCVFCFNGSEELMEHFEKYEDDYCDIVITDIEMPTVNGIDMAKKIKAKDPRIQIIFVTMYTDYIEKSFDADPVFYMLKPLTEERVKNALERAMKKLEDYETRCVNVSTSNKLTRICYSDIKYAESQKRTVYIHKYREDIQLNMKLDELEEKLPDSFIRVHKSYLVNMNLISSIANNKVELLSGESVPIAKSKYSAIKSKILDFLGEQI